MHFEVRKKVHRKLAIFIQNNIEVYYILCIYQQRGKLGSFLTSKNSCEQPSFQNWNGIIAITKKIA